MSRPRPTGRVIPVHPRPSPNHNARQAPIDMIVLHYTHMDKLREVLDKLCDPASEVSAHFVVDIDGRIFQLVGEERRAWHAGVSSWQGRRDVNSRSIGIEIMNNGAQPFTREQLISVVAICRKMMDKHDIPPHHVVGHSDVAPGRKEDPGPYFPWTYLARYGVGLCAEPKMRDYFAAGAHRGDMRWLRETLTAIGYGEDYATNPKPTLRQMVAAFQSRYEQEVYKNPARVGIPTRRTIALLIAQKRAYDAAEAQHQRHRETVRAVKKGLPPAPPSP